MSPRIIRVNAVDTNLTAGASGAAVGDGTPARVVVTDMAARAPEPGRTGTGHLDEGVEERPARRIKAVDGAPVQAAHLIRIMEPLDEIEQVWIGIDGGAVGDDVAAPRT